MQDAALTRALIAALRTDPDSVRVIALRRFQPEGRLARAFAAPAGLATALRAASRAHAMVLLVWIWVLAFGLRKKA